MIKKIDPIEFNPNVDLASELAVYVNRMHHIVNILIEAHNAKEPQEEWPKVGDEYWYFDEFGDIYYFDWRDSFKKNKFMNRFKTKEEAESARDKVRELLKSLQK